MTARKEWLVMQPKFCPTPHGDEPTGVFEDFYPSTDDHRAVDVYRCSECGELFALDYYGAFQPVPAEAVTP